MTQTISTNAKAVEEMGAESLDNLRAELAAAVAERDARIAELELRLSISRQSNKELRESAERAEARLAAIAKLERAAAEPVATVLGAVIEWTGEKPVVGTKLYTAPPHAPVTEMREPTDDECERIAVLCYKYKHHLSHEQGRDVVKIVRAVLGGGK